MWLGAVGTVAQISALWSDPSTGEPRQSFAVAVGDTLGLMIMAALAFGFVPAVIRRRRRRRREGNHTPTFRESVRAQARDLWNDATQRIPGGSVAPPRGPEPLPPPRLPASATTVQPRSAIAPPSPPRPSGMSHPAHDAEKWEWDVALSFAGEDRPYVEQIATALRDQGVRVFYDRFEVVETWGTDLYRFFDEIYRKKARYAILFISSAYTQKIWTRHESQSAQARALESDTEYLLPVRLDDSDLPGLRPTVGYLDAREFSLGDVVDAIVQKCAPQPDTSPTFSRVPRTPAETAALLVARPPSWEYLLFAATMLQRRDALEAKWRDHQMRFVSLLGRRLSDEDAVAYVSDATSRAGAIVSNTTRILDERVQRSAFGPPGEPGDPERIEHLASRLIDVYDAMLDWSADVRATRVSDHLTHLFDLLADLLTLPIEQYRDFVDTFRSSLESALTNEPGEDGERQVVRLTLTITIDDALLEELTRELRNVHGSL